MVSSYTKLFYVCRCDICNKCETVEGSRDVIYNAAQAVRSLGWSYGKDCKIKCSYCRRFYKGRRFIY